MANTCLILDDRVDILLPTFNGGKYLIELLDSISCQSYKNIRLLIRDDSSSDRTCEIVAGYDFCFDSVFYTNSENLGVVENINLLLEQSESPYIMFADQDDVWLKDKVASSLKEMKASELKFDNNIPVVVFTDAYVGNEVLIKQPKSLLDNNGYFEYGSLHESTSFKNLVVQNTVSGCTMMINTALKKYLNSLPGEAIMHDWWIMLVASAIGKVVFLPDKTMIYRLHENNTLGIRSPSLWGIFVAVFKNPLEIMRKIKMTYGQANTFKEMYSDLLTDDVNRLLNEYILLSSCGFFHKFSIFWRNRFRRSSIGKTIGFYFLS